MTLRVVYRRAAQAEFQDAAVWYEQQRTGLAEVESAAIRSSFLPFFTESATR
jgi:hypothetical protein